MEIKNRISMLVSGPSNSGKSTVARAIFREFLIKNNGTRTAYYVLDQNLNHFHGNEIFHGLKSHGFDTFEVGFDFIDGIRRSLKLKPKDKDELLERIDTFMAGYVADNKRVVFAFDLPPDLQRDVVDIVATHILRFGNAAVLMDETSRLVPATATKVDNTGMLITSGRNKGIDIIVVTQHPNLTNRIFHQTTGQWLTFGTKAKHDLDKLREYFGDRVDEVTNLKEREMLVFWDNQTMFPPVGSTKYFTSTEVIDLFR